MDDWACLRQTYADAVGVVCVRKSLTVPIDGVDPVNCSNHLLTLGGAGTLAKLGCRVRLASTELATELVEKALNAVSAVRCFVKRSAGFSVPSTL